ncbi:hypothetical protein SAMN05421858_2007 [Haladaptatus litoreus]|uniref:Uncharacterized protein n=1 Tax=Haladaptatus litoreus TaxID=553468 RepID=A0A1N6ZFG3_9EURY|nr:hypothetical protein [Haladaptatus litoreus]SIR25514.1 hypothetical protein SAMN05421858_2007 [Haladaptatus litoreus]
MRFITAFALWAAVSYVSIVVLDTFLMGETRWLAYIPSAVGSGIGISIAQKSNFRLSF